MTTRAEADVRRSALAARRAKAGYWLAALTFVAALFCLSPAATATTKSWIGGSGQWDVSGNWNPGGQPLAGDNVYLTQSDATDRIVTYYNTLNPADLLKSLRIDATGAGTMTLDMPNNHALSVTTEYVGYSKKGAVTQSAGTNNAATLYLGYNAGSIGSYTITGGTLSSSLYQYIGYYGTGTLNIQNGGQVSNAYGYLGHYTGSTGTATVDGSGSKWTNSGDLTVVGRYGTGTLNILNGGEVSSFGGYLGYYTGSTGTATVDGIGSLWNNTWSLHVGGSSSAPGGTGSVTVKNGGEVSNTTGYIGYYTGSSGTATVDGIGSKWTNSEDLYVGRSGTGTLNILNGGEVSNTNGTLGDSSGASATATVDGIGSKWTNSGTLYVGRTGTGTGTLNILNGGQVSNNYCYLGYYSSSGGTATVDGIGSKWTNSRTLYVGYSVTGTLNIRNGGQVSSATGYLGYYSSSGGGTVTVDGIGSLWNNTGSLYVGGASSAAGGTGSVTVTNGGQLTVGGTLKTWKADSTVTVNGGTLTAGSLTGSTGIIRITDPAGGTALTVGSGVSGTFSGTIHNNTGPGSLTKVGAGTQTLAGANTYTGATTVQAGTLSVSGTLGATAVSVAGGAAIVFGQSQQLPSISLTGTGTASLTSGTAKTLRVGSLILGESAPGVPTSRLDLAAGNLIVDYADGATSPLSQVATWLRAGYNKDAGYWDGPGIRSSTAAAEPEKLTAVGVLDNSDPLVGGRTTLEGEPVDASSVLVKYTYWGDANFDGRVTFDDYDVIDYYYWFPLPADQMGWWTGDLDYDGNVDFDDYDLIDYAYWFQGAPLVGDGLGTVPEPATLTLLALGGLALAAKKKRR